MNWKEIQKVRKTFEIDKDAVFDYEDELKVWIVGPLAIVDLLPEGGIEFEEMYSDFYAKAESIFQPYLTECDAAEGFRLYKFKAPYVEFGRRVDEADVFFIHCVNNGTTYLASSNLVALRTLVLNINEKYAAGTSAYFDRNDMRDFALKVDKNKTNQMAENTINMYGGSYVDVHDNEVVNIALSERGANLFATPSQSNVTENNLNIDKASVQVQDNEAMEKAKVLTENATFMQILQKAVEQGFCLQIGWQYKWDVKVEAAYFASLASEKFKLSKRKINGKPTVSWVPFEALFGLNDLRMAFNDYKQCKTALVREEEIDELFE